MAEITQVIPAYTGTPPNRFNQLEDEFSDNADFFAAYLASTPNDYNTFATQANAVADEVNTLALSAQLSAENASSAANYAGEWSGLTGAIASGVSVSVVGTYWRSTTAIADVTLSEPSSSNSDWDFISGNRWSGLVTSSRPANRNELIPVYATISGIDFDQPLWSSGDFLVISNSPSSTWPVRILNPSNSIVGSDGTVSAGDNLLIPAGDTVQIYARTSSILEVK